MPLRDGNSRKFRYDKKTMKYYYGLNNNPYTEISVNSVPQQFRYNKIEK